MGQKAKYLFKNMGILTISNFASKILVFLLVPLYTSVLSTSEYGIYDLMVSTILLLYPVLTLNILDAVMRYCMDKNCAIEEVASVGCKRIIISIFAFGIIVLFVQYFDLFPETNGLRVYAFVYYASYIVNQFFVQFAKGLEKVTIMAIAGVIGSVIMLAGNIFFLLVLNLGLPGFFLANILAQLVPAIFYCLSIKFWRYITPYKRNKELEKQMIVYCFPLLFTTLGWWINSVADRYTVSIICGVAANGVLSVAYKIPSIINTLQTIFVQAWQISAIKEYGENNSNKFFSYTFEGLGMLMTMSCTVLIALSKTLAYFLYSNEFFEAWKYAPFLMISTVINCSSGFIGPILAAKKDSKSMALSSIYGAIVNIVFNIILVFFIGVQGATLATVISSFTIYYFRYLAVKNDFKTDFQWKLLSGWLLLMLQGFIDVYLHLWPFEILVMCFIVLLYKNSIIKAFKSFANAFNK